MAPHNIPWAKPAFWGNEKQYIEEALYSTWISGGPFVERLEANFRLCTGREYAVAVSNGTASIHLAYLALGIRPGDEVIVPGFGFMAAANVALQIGARPVFAEVDSRTWCLNAEAVEKRLTPRTKLIVPIHTYGNVCEMDEITILGKERNIAILEDAAEAMFSLYKGKPAGSLGVLGAFSFQATKTITTGEGGMVVTDVRELNEKMLLYRSHGMGQRRYWHEVPGHNFRLTNLQAALGCAQFEHRDEIMQQRSRVHENYRKLLGDLPGITLQAFSPEVKPVLWAMAVRIDPQAYPQGRDALISQLQQCGIETRPGFYAASQMKIYESDRLPVCEGISQNVISLPTFPSLEEGEINFVCDQLKALKR
ncbi:MAG: DegT/DnrJ/EryC1/StrS family aminotransferase [Terriglobia bacterium]